MNIWGLSMGDDATEHGVHAAKFACDGVTDDSNALAKLFRRAFLRGGVRRSGKDHRSVAEINDVSENEVS
jgi:hypothetical protein